METVHKREETTADLFASTATESTTILFDSIDDMTESDDRKIEDTTYSEDDDSE